MFAPYVACMNALLAKLTPIAFAAVAGAVLASAIVWKLGLAAMAVVAPLGGGMSAAGVILWLLASWSIE